MSLQPDFTFVIQIISFLVLWFGLKRLLFDPVLRVLEQREARTSGTQHAATEMKRAAETAAAEYERRMHEVRQGLQQDIETMRSATQTEQRQILAEARQTAGTELARLRDDLNQQAQTARVTLATEARTLSARLLERAVGRPIG